MVRDGGSISEAIDLRKTLENGAKFGFVSSILVEIGGFVFLSHRQGQEYRQSGARQLRLTSGFCKPNRRKVLYFHGLSGFVFAKSRASCSS